jgi:NTE family protein
MIPNPAVISQLKDAGRAAADAFLRGGVDNIGTRSSVDLREMFA